MENHAAMVLMNSAEKRVIRVIVSRVFGELYT